MFFNIIVLDYLHCEQRWIYCGWWFINFFKQVPRLTCINKQKFSYYLFFLVGKLLEEWINIYRYISGWGGAAAYSTKHFKDVDVPPLISFLHSQFPSPALPSPLWEPVPVPPLSPGRSGRSSGTPRWARDSPGCPRAPMYCLHYSNNRYLL